jgi:hypothetical protein
MKHKRALSIAVGFALTVSLVITPGALAEEGNSRSSDTIKKVFDWVDVEPPDEPGAGNIAIINQRTENENIGTGSSTVTSINVFEATQTTNADDESIAASIKRSDQQAFATAGNDEDDQVSEAVSINVSEGESSAGASGESTAVAGGKNEQDASSRAHNDSDASAVRTTASATMRRLILLAPWRRSTNVIGTSTTRKPARHARSVVSTWKQ